MGRRKSKRKPPPRPKSITPLPRYFDCPFCNHPDSCDVVMDRRRNVAQIRCRICFEDFRTRINVLSQPIDVYNDWIDACEDVN